MKPFRLANLVRVRKLQEKQAASELAQQAERRRKAAERKENAERQLYDSGLPSRGDSLLWQAAVGARAAASSALSDAQVTALAAAQREAAAQRVWVQAKSQTTTLDKLEQKHVVAERAEELRTEQRTLDEIAGQRAGAENTGES